MRDLRPTRDDAKQREADVRVSDDGEFAGRVARARDGDAVAWSELYHHVAPVVIGYLRAQRLPDPEDVAGDVMLEVVRDIHRFEGGPDGFRSWVLAIAHHRLLDARRRIERRPVSPTTSEHLDSRPAKDDTEADTLAGLGFGVLESALETLTDEQRAVLLLRVIGDLPITEVARITGRKPGAVKQLQRRAAAAMRRALDEPDTSEEVISRAHTAEVSAQRTPRDIGPPGNASPSTWTS